MGGAVEERGNIPPLYCAEYNSYCDPSAVAKVLSFTVPVIVVPLDVTHRCVLTRSVTAQFDLKGLCIIHNTT